MVNIIISTFLCVSICIMNNYVENGIPVPELDQKEDGDCIWEYDILGLWSIGIE